MSPQSLLEIAGLPVTKKNINRLAESTGSTTKKSSVTKSLTRQLTEQGSNETVYAPDELTIEYQANYNGCSVYTDEGDSTDVRSIDAAFAAKMDKCSETIVEFGSEDSNDDGEYQGSKGDIKRFAVATANKLFGPQLRVKFIFDDESS